MIKFKSYRYILDQSRPHEDSLKILNDMFIKKGDHVESIEFLDNGEFKVTVRVDVR